MEIQTKKCNACLQIKPVSEFHRHCHMKDGYRSRCKACDGYGKRLKEIALQKNLVENGFKKCIQCHEIKATTEFNKNSNHSNGFSSMCRECNKLFHRKWREQNKIEPKIKRREKKCSACKQIKPVNLFNKKACAIDGYCDECRECSNIRKREFNRTHPEIKAKRDRVYYQKNKEKRQEYALKWRTQNKEELKRKKREYRENNKEKVRDSKRREYQKNKENYVFNAANRRSRELNAKGKYTREDVMSLLSVQKGKCLKCGQPFTNDRKPSVDHIIPLSKGGHNSIENLQLLCKPCNSSKGVNIEDLRTKGMLRQIFKQGELFNDPKSFSTS